MKKTFKVFNLKICQTVATTPEQQGTLNIIPSKTGMVEMAIECRIEDIYLKFEFDTILVFDFLVSFTIRSTLTKS